jgi:hypothetical protein
MDAGEAVSPSLTVPPSCWTLAAASFSEAERVSDHHGHMDRAMHAAAITSHGRPCRVLRDEDGVLNQETLALVFGATVLALGGLALVVTGSLGWALAASVLGGPLQLMGVAYRPTAPVVAGLGTILLGGAATVTAALLTRLFLPSGLAWGNWLVGGAVGFLFARATLRSFNRATQKLDKPGWY